MNSRDELSDESFPWWGWPLIVFACGTVALGLVAVTARGCVW